MKYIKLLQARQTSGLSNNVTTANEKYIRNLTSGGETYTRDYNSIDPLTMSTPELYKTDTLPFEAERTYYPKNAMGDYSFGQIQITPTQGTAPTIEVQNITSSGGGINIMLSVEAVGDYVGTISVPVTSTGYALLDGVYAKRTISDTFTIPYELHCIKNEVGVIYGAANSSAPGVSLVQASLEDYQTHEYYAPTSEDFAQAWTEVGNVGTGCTVMLGSVWDVSTMNESISDAEAILFFLSNYSPDMFSVSDCVVLGTGGITRASTFGALLAQSAKRLKESFVYVGVLSSSDEGSEDVNKAEEYDALNTFMAATGATRDTSFDSMNQMMSSSDLAGASAFIQACLGAGLGNDVMIVVPDANCALAVLQTLQGAGYNATNEEIDSDPSNYFCLYCIDNCFFYPDVVAKVNNNEGMTGCAFGTPGNAIISALVNAYFDGTGMNAFMEQNGYYMDSKGRYNLFTWDHAFSQYSS